MSKKNKPIHIKLIVNPDAGKVSEATENLKLVTGYLEKSGFKVDVSIAKPKEEATPIARQAVKDRYKIVIAMGGDGTVKAVMHGLIGSKARLGIVPTGIENNIAVSLGIPKDLLEACSMIASDNTLKLDMGQVTGKRGHKFVFFEMAAIGLSAAIYPDANKEATVKLSKARATALTLLHREKRPEVFLKLDNENKIEVETMLVMVSNAPGFGINNPIAPGASMQDGLLDISVYPDFGKIELLRYYADLMDGGYSGDGKVQHYQARKIKIKTSPRLDVMADGISLGKGTIKIKVRPEALRVITTGKGPDIEKPQNDNEIESPESAKQPTIQDEKKDLILNTTLPISIIVEPNHRKKAKISSITGFNPAKWVDPWGK